MSLGQFLIIILLLFWIVLTVLILYKYGYLDIDDAFATHVNCYTNVTSVYSHFDIANLTILLNITHPGFCQSF